MLFWLCVSLALRKTAISGMLRGERALEARARSGHSALKVTPSSGCELAGQLVGVGELRDPARRDEARDLDALEPGGDQRLDQAQLAHGADRGRLVLQPVARADLVDRDAIRKVLRTVDPHA